MPIGFPQKPTTTAAAVPTIKNSYERNTPRTRHNTAKVGKNPVKYVHIKMQVNKIQTAKAYTINRAKCVVEMAGNNLLVDCSFLWLSAVQLMKRILFYIGLYRAAFALQPNEWMCFLVLFLWILFVVDGGDLCARLIHSVSLFSIRINLKWKYCDLSVADLCIYEHWATQTMWAWSV